MARNDGMPASPAALPRATWRDTLVRTLKAFRANKLNHWGAALTYYAVLSLFPAIMVAILLGAQLNAETERTRQLEAGIEDARERLAVEPREPAKS